MHSKSRLFVKSLQINLAIFGVAITILGILFFVAFLALSTQGFPITFSKEEQAKIAWILGIIATYQIIRKSYTDANKVMKEAKRQGIPFNKTMLITRQTKVVATRRSLEEVVQALQADFPHQSLKLNVKRRKITLVTLVDFSQHSFEGERITIQQRQAHPQRCMQITSRMIFPHNLADVMGKNAQNIRKIEAILTASSTANP